MKTVYFWGKQTSVACGPIIAVVRFYSNRVKAEDRGPPFPTTLTGSTARELYRMAKAVVTKREPVEGFLDRCQDHWPELGDAIAEIIR